MPSELVLSVLVLCVVVLLRVVKIVVLGLTVVVALICTNRGELLLEEIVGKGLLEP